MVINPIVGVYIPIIRIPIKGGMTIPNIATFDHGTYQVTITMEKSNPRNLREPRYFGTFSRTILTMFETELKYIWD